MTVRRTVSIDVPVERAFRVFTENVDAWWPREHSIGGKPLAVAVLEPRAGGRWFERDHDGRECYWGRVLVWEPFTRIVLSWQISPKWQFESDTAKASEVDVRFIEESALRTRVELEHRNLDRHGADANAMRDAIASPGGWTGTLGRYAAVAIGALREGSAIRGIDATAYLVKDLNRAKAFWRDTMSLALTADYPSLAEFTLADGSTFGLYKMDDATWYSGNGVLFNVGDIKEAVTDYKRRGVKFQGDGLIEESPICFMAFGEDSKGNSFLLHQHRC